METAAREQLQLFKDSNDAFEKRGYANAVSNIKDTIEKLYNEVRIGRPKEVEVQSIEQNPLNLLRSNEDGRADGEETRQYSY